MDTYEVGKEFEIAPEEAISPRTDEIGEQLKSANEPPVGPSPEIGRDRRNYRNLQRLFFICCLLLTGLAIWGVTRGIKQDIPLPASAIVSESGSSYTTTLPTGCYWFFETLTDSPEMPTRSKTELFEDGKPLGPAHSTHDAIRAKGAGQFSHWGSTLYFSTSDNSEPRVNGRSYKAVITATLSVWVLALLLPFLLISCYLNREMLSWPLRQPAGGLTEKMRVWWGAPAEPPLIAATPWWADWRNDKRTALMVLLPPAISLLLGIILHALLPVPAPIQDAKAYIGIANGLIGQNQDSYYGFQWAVSGLAVRGFLYPSFVAIVYWLLGGQHPGVIGWIQAVVMVPLTTFLIYVAGRAAFSRRVGIIASWAFALWFPAVWYTVWVMTETLVSLLMALAMALLAAAIARRSAKPTLWCGVVIGLLSVTHSAYQFLPLIILLAFLVHLSCYDRHNFRLAGFFLLGVLLIQAPYRLTVFAADLPRLGQGAKGYGGGGGWGFYVSSRAETNFLAIRDDYQVTDLSSPGRLVEVGQKIDRGEIRVEPHLLKIIREKLALPDALNQTLTDGDYYRAGIQNLLDHPDKWPTKLRITSHILFVFPDNGFRFYEPDPTTATWFWTPWPLLNWGLVSVTFLGLLFAIWKRRDRLLIFVPFVFQIAVFLAVIAEWRYIIPFWPVMFLLAVSGAAGWLERLNAARSWLTHRSSLERA